MSGDDFHLDAVTGMKEITHDGMGDNLEWKWKTFREKEKAKRHIRSTQLDVARPTSEEGWARHSMKGRQSPRMRTTQLSRLERGESDNACDVDALKRRTWDYPDLAMEEPEGWINEGDDDVEDVIFIDDAPRMELKTQRPTESKAFMLVKDEDDKKPEVKEPSSTSPSAPLAKVEELEDNQDRDDVVVKDAVNFYKELMRNETGLFSVTPVPDRLHSGVRCRINREGCQYIMAVESLAAGDQSSFGPSRTILLAKKKRKTTTTIYEIVTNKGETIGGVKANVLGTHFIVYRCENEEKLPKGPSGIDSELALVTYRANVLGLKGPRRLGLFVPGMTAKGERVKLKKKYEEDSIAERLKNDETNNLIKMWNKTPQWNEGTQSFVLNFGGRVTQASIKNFQVVHEKDPDYVVLQFGRVDADSFTLDFRFPLCALQAFGVALTSFDRKLACE